MDFKAIQLQGVHADDLLEQFRLVIRQEVSAALEKKKSEQLLSPIEVCKLFKPNITRPTLDKLSREGGITKSYINSRVYYKYSDIMNALKTYKKYEQSK